MSAETNTERRLHNVDSDYIPPVSYPIEQMRYPTVVFRGDPADGIVESGWKLEGESQQPDGSTVYLVSKTSVGAPGNPEGMTYRQKEISEDLLKAANQRWEELHPPKPREVIEQSGEDALALANGDPAEVFYEQYPHDPLNDDMIIDTESGEPVSPEDYYARKRARDAAVDVAPEVLGLGSKEKLRGLIDSRVHPTGSGLQQFEVTTDPNIARRNVLEGINFILDSLEDRGPGRVSAEDLIRISSMLKNTPRSGNLDLDTAVQDLDGVCMELNLDLHTGTDQKERIEKLYELYEIIKKGIDALRDNDSEVGEGADDPGATIETPILDEPDVVEPSADVQQEQEQLAAREDVEEALEASGEDISERVNEPQVAEEAISQAEAGIDEPRVDGPQEQTRLDAREDIEGAFTQPEAEPAIPVEQSSGEAQPDQAPDEGEPQEMSEQEREALVEYDKKIAATAQGILEIGNPEELRERGNKMDRVSAGLDALQQSLGSPQSIINEQPLIHSLIRNIAELKEDNDGYLRSDQVVVGRAQEVEGTKNQSSMDFAGKMISKQAQDQARNLLPAVDSIVGQMTYEAVSINNVTHMIEERLKSLSKILSEMAQPRHDQGVEVYAHIIRNNVLKMRELASAYKSNANRIQDIHAGAGALLASVAK